MQPSAIIAIIAAHFLGDWFFQSREMAVNKSKETKWLVAHLLILAIPITIVSFALPLPDYICFSWIFINLICHGIQDWYIWRIAGYYLSKKCKTKEDAYNEKLFWDVVGLDSLLHYIVYFSSFWALGKFA